MKNLNYPISVQLDAKTLERIDKINEAIISNREKVLLGLSKYETRYRTIFESILKDFNCICYRASHGVISVAYSDLRLCEEKSDILFRHISISCDHDSVEAAKAVYSMFALFRSLRQDIFPTD